MISLINDDDGKHFKCREINFFSTTRNNSQLNYVVPSSENEIFLMDAPEVEIVPGCTYEIEVLANPRFDRESNIAKVYYYFSRSRASFNLIKFIFSYFQGQLYCFSLYYATDTQSYCGCQDNSFDLIAPKIDVELLDSNNALIHWSRNENVDKYIIR